MNKKIYIRCNNISKSYDGINNVIQNFSYEFSENQVYLILGSSGSGKTTLLNILSGLLEIENGSIDFFGFKFCDRIPSEMCCEQVAYITQNCYFVDYLTIKDNLELCCNDKNMTDEVKNYLTDFHLMDVINKYPSQLSGGERQRISIIQALLREKKIIILDEPTASLDKENREILKKILLKIKKNCVIICASHDSSMIEISDKVIDLNNSPGSCDMKKEELERYTIKNTNKSNLFKYMLKQLTYKDREKKSDIFLIIVLMIIFLLSFACTNSKEKLLESLVNKYNVNVTKIYCSVENKNYCKDILEKYNYSEIVYNYAENIPFEVKEDGTPIVDFDGTLLTLPYNSKLFELSSDFILYGSYYVDENDIILGYKAAESLNPNVKDLVGTKIKIKLPDGEKEFTICGIFKYIDNDNIYMKSMYGSLDYNMYTYINSKYLIKYMNDDVLGFNELNNYKSTSLYVYFSNSSDLIKFYNQYLDNNDSSIRIYDFSLNFVNYQQDIEFIKLFSYPVMIIAFISSIVFYFQTKTIQNEYKGYIQSVYYYYGYRWRKIFLCNLMISMISIITKVFLSSIFVVILSPFLNYLLYDLNIYNFKVFQIDWLIIFYLLLTLVVVTLLYTIYGLLKQKKKGWIYAIQEGDDLL